MKAASVKKGIKGRSVCFRGKSFRMRAKGKARRKARQTMDKEGPPGREKPMAKVKRTSPRPRRSQPLKRRMARYKTKRIRPPVDPRTRSRNCLNQRGGKEGEEGEAVPDRARGRRVSADKMANSLSRTSLLRISRHDMRQARASEPQWDR